MIILSGVMEHLFDLRQAVSNIGKYLKDGGLVFMGVPDVARYGQFDNAVSYYFNLEHINHFSARSLDNLMGKFLYLNVATTFHDVLFGNARVPVFSAFYRKGGTLSRSFKKDAVSSRSVRKYLALSRDRRAEALHLIDTLRKNNEEIIIWGAGCVASELLSATTLKDCNIKGFVDKDPGKHGNVLAGKTVRPPDILRGFRGTIVVCAAVYASDILKEIRDMNLENKVVVLR